MRSTDPVDLALKGRPPGRSRCRRCLRSTFPVRPGLGTYTGPGSSSRPGLQQMAGARDTAAESAAAVPGRRGARGCGCLKRPRSVPPSPRVACRATKNAHSAAYVRTRRAWRSSVESRRNGVRFTHSCSALPPVVSRRGAEMMVNASLYRLRSCRGSQRPTSRAGITLITHSKVAVMLRRSVRQRATQPFQNLKALLVVQGPRALRNGLI